MVARQKLAALKRLGERAKVARASGLKVARPKRGTIGSTPKYGSSMPDKNSNDTIPDDDLAQFQKVGKLRDFTNDVTTQSSVPAPIPPKGERASNLAAIGLPAAHISRLMALEEMFKTKPPATDTEAVKLAAEVMKSYGDKSAYQTLLGMGSSAIKSLVSGILMPAVTGGLFTSVQGLSSFLGMKLVDRVMHQVERSYGTPAETINAVLFEPYTMTYSDVVSSNVRSVNDMTKPYIGKGLFATLAATAASGLTLAGFASTWPVTLAGLTAYAALG
jgi:hypothetical protein